MWLELGRQNRFLLPWEKRVANCKTRLHCTVHRDYARVGLRHLSEHLNEVSPGELVIVGFDGEVLSIRVAECLVVMPASGEPWPSPFCIRAHDLSSLPKRLMHDPVQVAIGESSISIDRRVYEGVMRQDIGKDIEPDQGGEV